MTSAVQPLPIGLGDTLDIGWNWPEWLPAGDSVSTFLVTVDAPLTKGADANVDGVISAFVSVPADVTIGTELKARCKITTTGGRIVSRRYRLKVAEL